MISSPNTRTTPPPRLCRELPSTNSKCQSQPKDTTHPWEIDQRKPNTNSSATQRPPERELDQCNASLPWSNLSPQPRDTRANHTAQARHAPRPVHTPDVSSPRPRCANHPNRTPNEHELPHHGLNFAKVTIAPSTHPSRATNQHGLHHLEKPRVRIPPRGVCTWRTTVNTAPCSVHHFQYRTPPRYAPSLTIRSSRLALRRRESINTVPILVRRYHHQGLKAQSLRHHCKLAPSSTVGRAPPLARFQEARASPHKLVNLAVTSCIAVEAPSSPVPSHTTSTSTSKNPHQPIHHALPSDRQEPPRCSPMNLSERCLESTHMGNPTKERPTSELHHKKSSPSLVPSRTAPLQEASIPSYTRPTLHLAWFITPTAIRAFPGSTRRPPRSAPRPSMLAETAAELGFSSHHHHHHHHHHHRGRPTRGGSSHPCAAPKEKK